MQHNERNTSNEFCWMDLAASDVPRAAAFYGELFGWDARVERIGAGQIIRFGQPGPLIASAYQLRDHELAGGVPSHWTPSVAVAGVDRSVEEAVRLGARTVVRPFTIPGIGRISLIEDPVGALIGLYERVA